MIQTGVQNPEQLSHMLTTMSLGALGTEKAFAVQDKMVGRQLEGERNQLAGAKPGDLEFITGVTGGNGTAALGADVITRLSGKEQRQLYNATQRIQGRMQNQGIAAARDMGASGINTVAEAKMYFQGMPQFDFSSPEAAQRSAREIQEYTDNYNKQYNVDVGNGGQKSSRQQPATQQSVGGSYTSKSGIQFTVE